MHACPLCQVDCDCGAAHCEHLCAAMPLDDAHRPLLSLEQIQSLWTLGEQLARVALRALDIPDDLALTQARIYVELSRKISDACMSEAGMARRQRHQERRAKRKAHRQAMATR